MPAERAADKVRRESECDLPDAEDGERRLKHLQVRRLIIARLLRRVPPEYETTIRPAVQHPSSNAPFILILERTVSLQDYCCTLCRSRKRMGMDVQ